MQDRKWIKELLDEKYHLYNKHAFIEDDPILIPHDYSKKEDIEIAGFLTATISWGNRKSIIKNARYLMALMDDAPFEFILNHGKKDLKSFDRFVHRTFNAKDCQFFLQSLQNIYKNHEGLEAAFAPPPSHALFSLKYRIVHFRKLFLEIKHPSRLEKHISDPLNNSSAKRLCMYLRWMVRKDSAKVDFGIWPSISAAELCLPLDVHTGNVSRALGLLKRNQNDWKSVEEITGVLRQFDVKDPVKYDFALFGLGVNKELDQK
jgi:uncharacterized protein (TIGR02757 family)